MAHRLTHGQSTDGRPGPEPTAHRTRQRCGALAIGERVPNFRLTDQAGKEARLGSGKRFPLLHALAVGQPRLRCR
jgi:hypothetical protein